MGGHFLENGGSVPLKAYITIIIKKHLFVIFRVDCLKEHDDFLEF